MPRHPENKSCLLTFPSLSFLLMLIAVSCSSDKEANQHSVEVLTLAPSPVPILEITPQGKFATTEPIDPVILLPIEKTNNQVIFQPNIEGTTFIYETPGNETIKVWWEYEDQQENIIRVRFGSGNNSSPLEGTCRFQFFDFNGNLIREGWAENNCAIVGINNEGIQVKRNEFNQPGQEFYNVIQVVLQVRTDNDWETAVNLDTTNIFIG